MGYGRIGEGPIEGYYLLGTRLILFYLHASSMDVWANHCRVASGTGRLAEFLAPLHSDLGGRSPQPSSPAAH